MIAVIGIPRLRGTGPDADVAGLAASIASAAAAAGSRVELIGKTGDDRAGDAVLLALTRHFVGHVATLRDPARPTPVVTATDEANDLDPSAVDADAAEAPSDRLASETIEVPVLEAADVGLALRYLPELAVIVSVHVSPDVIDEAIEASSWADTALIAVVAPEADAPQSLPETAVVVAVADEDDLGEGAGAAIGRYAAALDQGSPAVEAYDALIATASP